MGKSFIEQPLEFRRVAADVVYRFLPDAPRNNKPTWKRVDKDLWLLWKDTSGWCVVDQHGLELSWPMPGEEVVRNHGEIPPEGIWLSKKGHKQYTYRLLSVAS